MLDDRLLEDGLEDQWRGFLSMMLKTSVEHCRWLSKEARNKKKCLGLRHRGSWSNRLYCACVAWRWIFCGSGAASEAALPFLEVCSELGVDEGYIRDRILDECPNLLDINQVVDQLLSELPERLGPPRRDRNGIGVVVEWDSLSKDREALCARPS